MINVIKAGIFPAFLLGKSLESIFLYIFAWSQPDFFLEYSAEIVRVLVTDHITDFLDGQIGIGQQFLGLVYPEHRKPIDKV